MQKSTKIIADLVFRAIYFSKTIGLPENFKKEDKFEFKTEVAFS